MQSVLMLAVIFLMVKFAWKPIVSALDEREEGIKNALEAFGPRLHVGGRMGPCE